MRRGWSLVETLIVGLVLAFAGAVLFPKWLDSRKSDLEMSAIRVLWQIREAEEILRSNDLDGNGNLDYWTRDVRGLARFRAPGSTSSLIDDRIAQADAACADGRPLHAHLYFMHPKGSVAGRGEEFLVFTRGVPLGSFRNAWGWGSERSHTYKGVEDRRSWSELPTQPAADGWGIACW